jgi:hypothetical protein
LGSYHYLKERGGHSIPCRVEVFGLEVTGHQHFWPEKGARDLLWLPVEQAMRRVNEPGLRTILKSFRKMVRAAA